jgi:integrase/recombinase XerD
MKITYKFILRGSTNKSLPSPIYMQITANRKTTKRAIGYEISEKEWDNAKEQAKNNHAVNTRINTLKSRLTDIQYNLQKNPQILSVSQIADKLFDIESIDIKLIEYFEIFKNDSLAVKKIGQGTYFHYNTCLKYIKEYILKEYNSNDIELSKLDYKFIEGYNRYLHQKELDSNTIISNHHKKFKTVLLSANRLGYLNHNPYTNFQMKITPKLREFLSYEELKQIVEYDFSHNPSLSKVKDLFVFACYTGMRFSDILDLQTNQIRKNGDSSFIYREQNKTGESINIPLIKEAIEIISKYKNTTESKVTNRVFPSISNQKINEYLKVIANFVGIEKKLTFHIARHTCATLLLNNGVALDEVSKLLGHSSLRTTQLYAKMQNKTIENSVIKAFNNIINN